LQESLSGAQIVLLLQGNGVGLLTVVDVGVQPAQLGAPDTVWVTSIPTDVAITEENSRIMSLIRTDGRERRGGSGVSEDFRRALSGPREDHARPDSVAAILRECLGDEGGEGERGGGDEGEHGDEGENKSWGGRESYIAGGSTTRQLLAARAIECCKDQINWAERYNTNLTGTNQGSFCLSRGRQYNEWPRESAC
jgi:hypothetical protein